MATLTITLAGSGLPNTNGVKTYTVSDADIQQVVNWAQTRFDVSGTNQQILLAWIQDWINLTRFYVREAGTTRVVVVPPPIVIT